MTDKGELYGSMQGGETSIIALEQLQSKADAIVETVSGTLLNIKDSAERKNKGFGMTGKTEQVTTTGKNLFLHGIELGTYSVNTPDKAESDNTRCRITEPIKINEGFNGIISIFGGYQIYVRTFKNNQLVAESGFLNSYKLDNTLNKLDLITAVIRKANNVAFNDSEIKQIKIQLEKGSTATPYEPYTGGKPFPSPEYPQKIVNAGKQNEDTGKYEVDVKVTGKNIFNVEKLNDKWNVGVNYYYIPLFVGKGSKVSFSVSKKLTTGLKAYALFSKEFGGNEKAYSWIYHSSNEGLIKAKGTFTAETDVISLSFAGDKDILINELFNYLQVEISETPTSYEPYKEQTLTLTSDRPLTKWDRLTEQDGQIGWLYKSITLQNLHERNISIHTSGAAAVSIAGLNCKNEAEAYCDKLRYNGKNISGLNDGEFLINYGNVYIKNLKITDVEQFKTWFTSVNPIIKTEAEVAEFVPLPQEQQNAIRALQTYYPTTVVSNSEDMEMELSYVADTKNYTDRKIEEAVSTQTQSLANLLSLMPLSTQAAMIEADTNNILDNMEVQK